MISRSLPLLPCLCIALALASGSVLAQAAKPATKAAPAKPNAASKAASKTMAKAAPKAAAMKPKPEALLILAVEPPACQIGSRMSLQLDCSHLGDKPMLKASHPGIRIGELKRLSPKRLQCEITATAELPRGAHQLTLQDGGRQSTPFTIHADDLPQANSSAADFAKGPKEVVQRPLALWGALTEIGQHDRYALQLAAAEELCLDLAVQQIGSAAKTPLLEVLDAQGKTLAASRGLQSGRDPFLHFKATAAGRYLVQISNITMDGSAAHRYRLSLGALPYATGLLPLALQEGQSGALQWIGHHLNAETQVQLKAGAAGEMEIKAPAALRWLMPVKLRVEPWACCLEAEPNDQLAQAQPLTLPQSVSGLLQREGDQDLYAFDAKAGESWIFETEAAQRGSPADTLIELLDAKGQPLPRIKMQAVRDSYCTFRGVDANNPDIRLQNWQEMDLKQFVWFGGDIMRIFRMPRGPDAGCLFYSVAGKRRAYFDSTAVAHALDEPCYVVEPRPLDAKPAANGLPCFTVEHRNDDSADRRSGSDSRLHFTATQTGRYHLRISDARGWGSPRSTYLLRLRRPQPDFQLALQGQAPKLAPGNSMGFSLRAMRLDGFEGPIRIDISGLPPGIRASTPLVIEEGHDLISGSLSVAANAAPGADLSSIRILASGGGKSREVGNFGKVQWVPAPKYTLSLLAEDGGDLRLVAGGRVKAMVRAKRNGDNGIINLDVHGLPHGVIVDDIGLNGVQIREGEQERPIYLSAAAWVKPMEVWCHAAVSSARSEHDSAALQTSPAARLRILAAKTLAKP